MHDKELMDAIIQKKHYIDMPLWSNVALHPDAKTFLPKEIMEKAIDIFQSKCGIKQFEQYQYDAADVIALLSSSEEEAKSLNLGEDYIKDRVSKLKDLLVSNEQGQVRLLDILAPFRNLSVAESNKELLAKVPELVELLLNVLELEHSDDLVDYIAKELPQSKQEAAKILWNLSYSKTNHKNIEAANGIKRLKQILPKSDNSILRTNIEGTLFVLENKIQKVSHTTTSTDKAKHIMISYNWGNQATILRLAKSLKEKGYAVWLDVDEMKGSTLEAMADAIENSALVLMCVSQKYKESPNCRLEGDPVCPS